VTETRSRRGLGPLVLVAVMVVLAVAGVVFLSIRPPAEAGAQDGSGGLPPGPAPSLSAAPPPEVALPGRLSWIAVAGVQVPVSDTAGPRRVDAGTADGFAHDQAGAVLAGLHILARTSPRVGSAVFGPTIRDQVVGPDRPALVDQITADYREGADREQVPYGSPLAPAFGSVRGYRLDAYTERTAALRYLFELPTGDGGTALISTVVSVTWVDGDWRLVAPPRGDWAAVRMRVPATAVSDYQPLTVRS
jgi:hypothetical protein